MLTLLDGVAWDDLPVPGEGSHRLLGELVVAYPRVLAVGDLVERVWGDQTPEHPEKALQVLVSRTRRRTHPDVVVHAASGYRLGLRADQVDVLRLLELVRTAREARSVGDLDVVRHTARDALAVRVTGSSLDETPQGDLVRAAVRAQDEARRLLGAALAGRGESEEALPLLERALETAPGDEDLLADLLGVEAAVRGVPAALQRYATYAEHALEVSGAEPGERLRRMHADLLARDAPVREGLRYDATPMVGRDEDVTRLRGLLSTHRVVTVVGPGGLGKTRVAHLLGRLAPQPMVWFVELAGVTTGDGVVRKVAADLGVRDRLDARAAQSQPADLRARLAQRLGGAPALLVLDNCEHVLDAAADLVAFLVAATDQCRVLATSRAPLAISAEQVYPLTQLDVEESVELFGRRARAARPGVRLDDAEVRALVARLDGLPLALELAAAKVRAMPVSEIARRLADRFALLAGGDRSAPDRHRTLEAVIDWSWRLLRPEAQRALERLAVFPDGFGLDGAAGVLGTDPVGILAELADQSLVVLEESDAALRYRFLETVRDYALRRLDDQGLRASAERDLATWAVARARDLAARLFTTDQPAVMDEVRAEVGTLVGVLRAALDRRDLAVVVPLVSLLVDFWSVAGEHLVVMGWVIPVLDRLDDVTEQQLDDEGVRLEETRGVLSMLAFNEALFTGRLRPGVLDRLRSLGTGPGGRTSATAVLLLAMYADGVDENLAAVERLAEDPDPAVARHALQWLAHAQENLGDVDAALVSCRRAIALCDDSEGPWLRAQMHSELSGLEMQCGRWEECAVHARLAMDGMQRIGAVQDVLQLDATLGLADIALGRLEDAGERLRRLASQPGAETTPGWSAGQVGLAELALAEGDVATGLALYRLARNVALGRDLVTDLDFDPELTPWVLFAEASALYAHAAYDAVGQVSDLAEALRAKAVRVLGDAERHVDYPVTGCLLLALGAYDLVAGSPVAPAVRALALARRFGYQRNLPSMAWDGVVRLGEQHASGALDEALSAYADRLPTQLRQEAVEAVARA
ncbi:SARP family transcriptional regulator [Marmoricola endophyticus]|uniref:SARP family transcriptional regulator n=1 Tax=Marmoricola endophyticus TaxID=2040280 RepID=A0A917F254_9ACTN|nr:AAA family ATPase [Marmoricola endophyticus]GGF35531.1 SARP family transcriptional regulator [Marmoricola endophyticus]